MGAREDKVRYIRQYVEGATVLDLGCYGNYGDVPPDHWLHGRIAAAAEDCLGLEIDESAVAELQADGYEVVQGDASDFDLDRTFDVVTAGEVIVVPSNPGGVFESASRHLRPGGLLVVTTANPFALVRFAHFLRHGRVRMSDVQVSWYDPRTLRQFAQRYGFRERDVYYPRADDWGVTQVLHRLGLQRLEDDFVSVFELRDEDAPGGAQSS